jgi:probable rRNA maturation factor
VSSPEIAIHVEAGDWPPEAALRELSRRALGAAAEAVREEASSHPSRLRQGFGGQAPDPPPLLRQAQDEGERGDAAAELSIVFTDDAGIRKLNAKWRGKDFPTNVLSFPQAAPLGSGAFSGSGRLLGDVILSAETVAREAALAEKPLVDHMAHLIIHAYLHLLGFDHEVDSDAEKMEQLERVALKKLGIRDPYATLPRR